MRHGTSHSPTPFLLNGQEWFAITEQPERNPPLAQKLITWQQKANLKLLIVLKIVHNDQVLDKQGGIPFLAPDRGLTPSRQAINIRTVSTRQAIPP
ncbi:hypothetical protein [Aeromonas salmonicida]|uniref:hypothetical protein n=1 Tax=Aeromonas salmonicida TaxID=645 RepID=UPI00232C789F|nr:hypothetical protein [Aeromonas salmonicida]WCH21200.1 hypothetical protein ONZ54_13705 [Aeromonas salmonicida]